MIAAAKQSEDAVGKKQGGGFQFLAGSGEVMENDPEREKEAESSKCGQVATGFDGDSLIIVGQTIKTPLQEV